MFLKMRKGLVTLLAVSAGVLSACGGGGDSVEVSGGVISVEPQKVSSRVQPADAVQDVSPIRQRLQSSGALPRPGQVVLGPLLQTQAASLDNSGALRIGSPRNVAATATAAGMHQKFQWQSTPTGGHVGAISFFAEGAKGLRLGVVVRQLSGGATLRLYSQAQSGTVYQVAGQEVLQRIDANLKAGDGGDDARTWWTPDLGFSEITLEVELPAGVATSSLDVAVPSVSHIFTDIQSLPQSAGVLEVGESNSCNLDVTCYRDLPSARDAVARMVYVKAGGSYLCTGTLMNNSQQNFTPYFLTANHCISSQTVASSLQTDWFYRSATCDRLTVLSASTKRYGGATLLYASGASDTSFMRLNDTPPAGAVFAGWDSNASAVVDGSVVLGLHHPRGDLLKISGGFISGSYSCELGESTFTCVNSSTGNYSRVQMALGITEGGSSGSPLFRDGYVVGTLTGGSSSCSAGNYSGYDYYGKFGVAYRAALNIWLRPTSSGDGVTRTAIYRFYNGTTGAHFFTPNAQERDFVIANNPTFTYEGVAFFASPTPLAGTNPVYRFYNRASGAHFYTISAAERDSVLATLPTYQLEGVVWHGRTAPGENSTAIYRFYNATRNVHFFTISASERDFLIANNRTYEYEGAAYYAWSP